MSNTKQNFTAIIYDKRGRVLSIGRNSYTKSHTLQAKHAKAVGLEKKIFLHSEFDAVIKCKDLSKAHRIVVTRVNNKGEFLNAKPCIICQSLLASTNIKIIEHS